MIFLRVSELTTHRRISETALFVFFVDLAQKKTRPPFQPPKGSIVYYEIPGQISLPKLRENGLDMDALCRHYVYITEFLWNVGFFFSLSRLGRMVPFFLEICVIEKKTFLWKVGVLLYRLGWIL